MNEELSNVSPEAVAPESTPETASAAETGVTQDNPAPSEPAKPKQTAEDNAAFAAMRRQLENERKEKTKYQNLVNSLQSGLKHQGFDGTAEDMAVKMNAEALGISPDEYKARLRADEASRDEAERMKTRLEEYERRERERQTADDLKAIKTAYPDVKVSTVFELGDKFLGIMATGTVDALTAYRIVRESEVKPAPPSTGSLKNPGPAIEKEYFTSDELDRLTPKQLDDPKILEKAMKSMTRLRK